MWKGNGWLVTVLDILAELADAGSYYFKYAEWHCERFAILPGIQRFAVVRISRDSLIT